MISWVIVLVFISIIAYEILKDRPTVMWVLLISVLTPRVPVGNTKIDGVYIIIIAIAIVIMLKRQFRFRPLKGIFKQYILLLILVHCIYLLAWLISNRNDGSMLIKSIVGAMKFIVLIWELYECNIDIPDINLSKEIYRFIIVTLVVTSIAVIYQRFYYNESIDFLSNVYFNDEEIRYLQQTTRGGRYARYYGLFPYPMHMGLFMTYSIVYVLGDIKINKIKKFLMITISLILGFYSGTKSFILGTALGILSYIALLIFSKKISRAQIIKVALSVFAVIIVILCYEKIYNFIYLKMGAGFARYFGYIKNFSGAFATRFDANSGSLIGTIEIVKKYWILGVGPDSINGEAVIDNAYLMILHNGGIIALMMVLGFYFSIIRKMIKHSDVLLLIFTLFATGVGFQTLFSVDISFWVICIIMFNLSVTKEHLFNITT